MEDRRKRRRFPVQKPAVLIVEGSAGYEIHGTSENVSELGALVLTDSALPEGTAVRLILTLDETAGLRLSCPGKVVRTESTATGSRIAIAVQCLQTLSEYSTGP